MKRKLGTRTSSAVSKDYTSSDRIKVAVRIRPPLFKEFHEEKAFFNFENVRINSKNSIGKIDSSNERYEYS